MFKRILTLCFIMVVSACDCNSQLDVYVAKDALDTTWNATFGFNKLAPEVKVHIVNDEKLGLYCNGSWRGNKVVQGCYNTSFEYHGIYISDYLSLEQQCETLIHEYAHVRNQHDFGTRPGSPHVETAIWGPKGIVARAHKDAMQNNCVRKKK